ncbi:high mobility group B protein 7 [Carica papaya]|uniref:high mobility group B protein 7 n=1 Tax=Carica papaya TaxID=3649 RepID=UPI000B8CAC49|nr:high mobility group B protein 7 [Carica papaya]
MVIPPRTRKRVHAVPRGPDGSAFEKCDRCGVMVPIALADMHDCEGKKMKEVKRFKGISGKPKAIEQSSYSEQPRSPFRFFVEKFMESCKLADSINIDIEAFETWKNMSEEERLPYVLQSKKVSSAYEKALIEEVKDMFKVDDEADSVMVGKLDKHFQMIESYGDYEDFDSTDSNGIYWSGGNGFSHEWDMLQPWIFS